MIIKLSKSKMIRRSGIAELTQGAAVHVIISAAWNCCRHIRHCFNGNNKSILVIVKEWLVHIKDFWWLQESSYPAPFEIELAKKTVF